MTDAQVIGDVAGSAAYIRSQAWSNGKIGVIGFCSGGRQTYLVACSLPDINAAVDCWGGGVIVDDPNQLNDARPVAPITLTEKLNCPLLGIFGNDDESPSPSEVDRTEEVLKKHGKTYEFYRYDGAGHAFFSTDRYRYRPEQAVDAWNKVFAFYNRYLNSAAAGSPPRFIGASPNVSLTGRVPLRPA
jgi:carboxymethylenebutenolidase